MDKGSIPLPNRYLWKCFTADFSYFVAWICDKQYYDSAPLYTIRIVCSIILTILEVSEIIMCLI